MIRKRFLLNMNSGELHDLKGIKESNCYQMVRTILPEHRKYLNGKEAIHELLKTTYKTGKVINGCRWCMSNIDNG